MRFHRLFVFVSGATAAIVVSCSTSNREAFTSTDASADGPTNNFGLVDGGDAVLCKGLACQQVDCGSGDTTLTGTVYAPNGVLPLYNAIVYVPNAPLEDVKKGVSCDVCGAVSGAPVVSALSDSKGR